MSANTPMRETTLHTRRAFDGHLVKLDVLDVRLPDGNTSQREIVQHPGAVAMIPLDDNQNVLLVRQFRTAADDVILEIPAGTLYPGEDPKACAIRELQEETGYKPNKIEPLDGIYTAPGYTTEFIHLFLTTELVESTLEADADEFIEVVRIPLAEAIRRVEQGEILDGKTVTGLLRVARKLGI